MACLKTCANGKILKMNFEFALKNNSKKVEIYKQTHIWGRLDSNQTVINVLLYPHISKIPLAGTAHTTKRRV